MNEFRGGGRSRRADSLRPRIGAERIPFRWERAGYTQKLPSSQATSRTKPPSAISQRHRRLCRRPIAARRSRRADSLRPRIGAEQISFRWERAGYAQKLPSSQATSRTKPPSAISQRHRRLCRRPIAARRSRRADSLRPRIGAERIPFRWERAGYAQKLPSSQATSRTKPPSAISQRKGKAAMVILRPVTSSMSPPAFSTVQTPCCMYRRWQGS